MVVGQRGIEPAEETPERETEAQLESGRRVNEGLVHIHLAFITQTEKVMVSEGRQTEGLVYVPLLEILYTSLLF